MNSAIVALGMFAVALVGFAISAFIGASRGHPSRPAFFGDETNPAVEYSQAQAWRNLRDNVIAFVLIGIVVALTAVFLWPSN